jgi:AcrR family transcriptional regulator
MPVPEPVTARAPQPSSESALGASSPPRSLRPPRDRTDARSGGASGAGASVAEAGALPAKQQRSRETRDRLLAAGRTLIESGGFEGTAVADIARVAGCSVGAFYFRFRDKDAFVVCVVEAAMAEVVAALRAQVAAGGLLGATRDETVAACVAHYADFARAHAGLLRALHRRTGQDRSAWQPARTVATELITTYVARIAQAAGRPGDRALLRSATVGFQIVSGALVNAMLNDPPLLGLDSPELGYWLTGTVVHCLDTPAPRDPSVASRR